jgi:hypothetical protein
MDEKDMSAMLTHWELEHYRQLYRNQIDRLVDTLTVRLLPTFDSVHAEVEALQEEAYRASQECDNDGNRLDPQMAHDAAFEASLAHFDIVLDLRQGFRTCSRSVSTTCLNSKSGRSTFESYTKSRSSSGPMCSKRGTRRSPDPV